MPQDHSTPFSWNNFYKKYRLSENSSQDDWRGILPARCARHQNGDWAKRFIALTRWFNVTDTDRNAVAAADRICTELRSVGYAQFSNQQNRKRLGDGLQEEGIILRNSNGQNQYLRTIMYYSGWMYVRFAKQISGKMNPFSWETIRKWEFPDEFKAHLQADFGKFSAQEGDEGFQDIKDFFKDLAELYFERNENFTAEELLKRRPELLPNAAKKIVETLCSPNANAAKSETLPQIDVDCDGNAVFTLPEEGLFTGTPVRVEFHFFDHEERVFRYAVYNRNNGRYGLRWLNEEQEEIREQNVPLEKIGSILRVCGGQKTDALPTVCISGAPHLLLKLEGGPGGYKRAPGNIRRLQSRTTYKVVSFRGEEPKIRIIDGEEGEKDELFPDVFTVPENAVSVRIDEIDYDVETSAATYLNLDNRTRAFSAENLPGRIFFETSSVPFTDNACGLSARYSWKENGDAHEETFQVCGEKTEIPETVFWREGFLELMADGRVLKRAVTFIDDVALGDFRTKAAEIDREYDWNIRIGNEDIEVHIPREKNRAKFDFKGFSFSIPVKRCGVYFETGTSGELVHVPAERFGEGRVHDVAREDFRRFVLHVRAGSDTDEITAIRGTAPGSLPSDKRKFIGEKLTSLVPALKDSDSDHYAFQIRQDGNSKFYKFHVYDPETTRVSGRKYVEAQREGVDLVLTFWCAFSNREKQKCLVFFPAHLQDKSPVSFDAEPVRDEIDAETGRRKETIRIRDFYKKEIAWGHGLLCFVAHKVSVRGKEEFRPLSMGFFLKAPKAKRSDNFADDPYGLRRALAGDEDGHVNFRTIEEIIVQNRNDAAQDYLDRFFESMRCNVLSSLTKGAFQSSSVAGRCLNAYWNRVSKEPSGYVFLCGRHYKKHINDYHEYWDKLLISYRDEPLSYKSCLNNFTENALLKPWWNGPIPNAQSLNNLSPRAKDALLTLVCKTLKLDFKTGTDQNANDEGGLIFYKDYWSFSYPQLSEAVRLAIQDGKIKDILGNIRDEKAKEIIETISRNWSNYRRRDDEESKRYIVSPFLPFLGFSPQHLGMNLAPYSYQAFSQAFKCFQDNPYMFYDGYGNSQELPHCDRCITFKNIQDFVKTIAGKLHEWRTKPNLEKAQDLRKVFFTLREIDRELFKLPELRALRNEQKIGLCDAIECYAKHLHRQEIGTSL